MPKKSILIAPLDWGLGHATRCIPIIKHLLANENEITIAGEGAGMELIAREFPGLPILPLKGYRVWYPQHSLFFTLSILVQLPKIIGAISFEKRWLSDLLEKKHFDLVISDNRYGLYSNKTRSVFITHQLRVISGLGRIIDDIIQWFLFRHINQFDECWIPDMQGRSNLAGELSHPKRMPKRYRFIGFLSRLENKEPDEKHELLVLLSGPEPQRTILERKLMEQLKDFQEKIVFVRGLPSKRIQLLSSTNFIVHEHMEMNDLSKALSAASIVICRPGYSSVMDLIKLKKKAILIPTPGQTEQIYLGKQLKSKKLFVVQAQDDIDLKNGLVQCQGELNMLEEIHFDGYIKAIEDLGI